MSQYDDAERLGDLCDCFCDCCGLPFVACECGEDEWEDEEWEEEWCECEEEA